MIRPALALAATLALSACTATPAALCRDGEELVIADTLYFGTNRPGGVVGAAHPATSASTVKSGSLISNPSAGD